MAGGRVPELAEGGGHELTPPGSPAHGPGVEGPGRAPARPVPEPGTGHPTVSPASTDDPRAVQDAGRLGSTIAAGQVDQAPVLASAEGAREAHVLLRDGAEAGHPPKSTAKISTAAGAEIIADSNLPLTKEMSCACPEGLCWYLL